MLSAPADAIRLVYPQLRQIDSATFDVLWKLSGLDESTTLKLRPVFPAELVHGRQGRFGLTQPHRWLVMVWPASGSSSASQPSDKHGQAGRAQA